jgi:hypothetical protein
MKLEDIRSGDVVAVRLTNHAHPQGAVCKNVTKVWAYNSYDNGIQQSHFPVDYKDMIVDVMDDRPAELVGRCIELRLLKGGYILATQKMLDLGDIEIINNQALIENLQELCSGCGMLDHNSAIKLFLRFIHTVNKHTT